MFETGKRVIAKDPVWLDEEVKGFIAKQLDDKHFLVKLARPFQRTNVHTPWLTVHRDFAHQAVREV